MPVGLAQFPRSQWRLWRVCRDARTAGAKLTYPGFGSDAVQAVLRATRFRVKGIVTLRCSKTSPWLTSTTPHHGTNRSRTQCVEWALLRVCASTTCSVSVPSAVSCTSHAMQPPVRQFPLHEKGHTFRTSGQLDPLLEFDSEDCIVGRREPAAVSVRPPTSRPAFRSEAARRPPPKIEARPAARSKADRSVWPIVVGATFGGCGGGRHRCADKPSADGFAEPGHASRRPH